MKSPYSQRSAKIRERLFECIHNGEIENSDLLEIFKLTGIFVGACTVKKFSELNGISPQSAHNRCASETFGFKMMFDAD